MEYRKNNKLGFKIGDFFGDCFGHPCIVTSIKKGFDNDFNVIGVSLFDAQISECSIIYCAPEKLTFNKVIWRLRNKKKWLKNFSRNSQK
jgi:hypothetical protein